jgi:hypothetical protein
MDCVFVKNYFIELLDRIFYWTEGAKIRQRQNIGQEKWDLMEGDITNNQTSLDKPDFNQYDFNKSNLDSEIIKTI